MSALLDSAVAQIGKLHDGPDVVRMAQEIAAKQPDHADYWRNTTASTPWCGDFIAWNLVVVLGLTLPGLRNGVGPLWVDWWLDYGTPIPVGQEQPGDLALWLGNPPPHHISIVAGGGWYVGGNQSDGVTRAHFRTPDAIRRPPQAAQIGTGPEKAAIPFMPLDQRTIDAITTAAAASDLAQYSWRDRGRAPIGYIKGMAVTFGGALRKLAAQDSAALAMVRFVDGPGDVFDQYDLGTLGAPNVDRLRALWTVLTGLGMRESSGNYSEGRDITAPNVEADTAEAGLFQQSWNSHTTSPEISKLLAAYSARVYPGMIEIFREGVRSKDTDDFGSGEGAMFQVLAKTMPAFAVEAAAIGLRTLYTHWGPIIRHEAEVVPAAAALFRQVQAIVDAHPAIKGEKTVTEPTTDQPTPAPSPQPAPTIGLPAIASMPPEMQRVINLVLGNRDQSHSFIDTIAKFHNAVWPDKQVVAGPQPAPVVVTAPAPTTTPLHQTAAFQIGAVGGVLTGILHQLGVIDPNMAILGAIVSAGTAFLGPAGGIVGTVIMNLIRAAAAASVPK